MNFRYPFLVIALSINVMFISACGGTATQSAFLVEEEFVRNPDPPEEYTGLANPFSDDPEAIAEGKDLYQANCSSCHGTTGEGDGPAAAGMDPPPQNLASRQSNLSDAYLFWRISDGGLMEPFNSIMPGWRGLLSDEQIWQIISFLRTMIVL